MQTMKKLIQGALLPFVIFTSGILLLGCEPSPSESTSHQDGSESAITSSEKNTVTTQVSSENGNTEKTLKTDNMFFIARDVADVQLKTGEYVEKLSQAQTDLQHALDEKDQQALQQTIQQFSQDLKGFNTALTSLNLKSQEIEDIRQHVLKTNQQLLNSPLLNGNVDIKKINIEQLEQQVDTIQLDMLKLAGMLLPTSNTESTE